jgi:hypothetical protein
MPIAQIVPSITQDAGQRKRRRGFRSPGQTDVSFLARIIERASENPKTEIEKLRLLSEMQQTILTRNARTAFTGALVELQMDLPIIIERGDIKDRKGEVQDTYALWEDINEAIRPILARHGFALSFRMGRDGQLVAVTGVLIHRLGHSEETTITLPTDFTGGKNGAQAIGSSSSYGKRYTAMALLNITSRGEDDDGDAATGAATARPEEQAEIRTQIRAEGADLKKLLAYFKVGQLEDLPSSQVSDALRIVGQRRARP